MVEVELKYRLNDPEELLTRLIARAASRGVETEQVDLYFEHPVRQFEKTDEAFRIRWDERKGLAITYKGPRLDPKSKTREEIEIGIAGGEPACDSTATLFRRLGFREVRRVSKRRTTFQLASEGREIAVSIDDVEGIGLFVELELITDEADWTTARESLVRIARSLGLSDREGERRSYLEMLLQAEQDRQPHT